MQGGSGNAYDLGDRGLGDLLLQEYADFFLLAVELGLAQRALGAAEQSALGPFHGVGA